MATTAHEDEALREWILLILRALLIVPAIELITGLAMMASWARRRWLAAPPWARYGGQTNTAFTSNILLQKS
jgi:hypothetical protein